jgi:thiol-disulfide isomerase/thioredoxin
VAVFLARCGDRTDLARIARRLPLLGGGEFRLADTVKGTKVVLVTFWFCGYVPCRKELAYLGELRKSLKADQVESVAINLGDSLKDIEAFEKKQPLGLKVGLGGDEKGRSEVGKAFGVQEFPTTYLVGPDGKVLWRKTGFDKAALADALAKAA